MSALPKTSYYTPQEYLRLEREANYKSEYFKGEIFAMAGASFNHNIINENCSILIGSYLKKKPCQSFSRDMKLHIPENSLYTYPDLMVVCGDKQFLDSNRDVIMNPVVIIEILSKTTEAYDRGEKFALYRSIPTLREYVMISSTSVRAEVMRKESELGLWFLASEADSLEGSISIKNIELELSLADIYEETEDLS
ncbi:MAG: Uma2 family endonuclease [Arcicella sp.]|jgi:Uma2 family endonuclease|nr:Uma2 family endonuclease [Arcicella sp.]